MSYIIEIGGPSPANSGIVIEVHPSFESYCLAVTGLDILAGQRLDVLKRFEAGNYACGHLWADGSTTEWNKFGNLKFYKEEIAAHLNKVELNWVRIYQGIRKP